MTCLIECFANSSPFSALNHQNWAQLLLKVKFQRSKVMSTSDCFKVYSRCRPLNEKQLIQGQGTQCVQIVDTSSIILKDADKQCFFQVDTVFNQQSSNNQVFEQCVEPLICSFLSGVNSSVLAYGITGAGKSHTMFGQTLDTEGERGLIPLALEYLLGLSQQNDSVRYKLSYIEIYNEQVYDLLKEKSENLQVIEDPLQGVIVNGLEQVPVVSLEQAKSLIMDGNTRRVVAETRANSFSSRSHAIVQLTMERDVGEQTFMAKLCLVDLAGSERQSVHAQNKGIRTLEGSNINKSLLTLGNCINILSERKKNSFLPYRDSKLTRILKDSLGGNTKTVMIACISPSILYYDESLNTMKYACRACKIKKEVYQNYKENKTIATYQKEIMELKKQNEDYRRQLSLSQQTNHENMGTQLHHLVSLTQKMIRTQLMGEDCYQQSVSLAALKYQQRSIINHLLDGSNPQEPMNKYDGQKGHGHHAARSVADFDKNSSNDSHSPSKQRIRQIQERLIQNRNNRKMKKQSSHSSHVSQNCSLMSLHELREKVRGNRKTVLKLMEMSKQPDFKLEEVEDIVNNIQDSPEYEYLTEQDKEFLLKLQAGITHEVEEHKEETKSLRKSEIKHPEKVKSTHRHMEALKNIQNVMQWIQNNEQEPIKAVEENQESMWIDWQTNE